MTITDDSSRSLGKNSNRLPHGGSVLVSSFTSPLDALYLAAIFDPIFTRSFPESRQVQQISLFTAMLDAFSLTKKDPPITSSRLVDVATILKENPDRCIAIFPECTTSNGRGILPFSPSVITVPERYKIFPVSLRYTPADVTTPLPGSYLLFLWNLCSQPTHTIRVRIAEALNNTSLAVTLSPIKKAKQPVRRASYETNFLDGLHPKQVNGNGDIDHDVVVTPDEQEVLNKIADALARLGRSKRVGLGVEDKSKFVRVFNKQRR